MTDNTREGKNIFQSTLPGWGATCRTNSRRTWRIYFNPRSPDGERLVLPLTVVSTVLFQSTLPGWGATHHAGRLIPARGISIHAPRMGSDPRGGRLHGRRLISIHAPRMGSDLTLGQRLGNPVISIHAPRMGSDLLADGTAVRVGISIHAPRMGSDGRKQRPGRNDNNFNPRSPDGERPLFAGCGRGDRVISIHAPRMGSD